MPEFLNFQEISSQVSFSVLLNHLNIPYTEKKNELKGKTEEFDFIVNTDKNLFFCPQDDSIKGSPINFYSHFGNCDLRAAAKWLKETFLSKHKEPKREIPTLTLEYHPFLTEKGISEELAKEFEIGYAKKGIMSGKIAIRIYGADGDPVGYIGRNLKDDQNKYFFPKGFKRCLYNLHRQSQKAVILTVSPFDVIHLHKIGFPFAVSLLGLSMTEEQAKELIRFQRLLLLHPQPENVRNRLSGQFFVKAPTLIKPVQEMTMKDIKGYF